MIDFEAFDRGLCHAWRRREGGLVVLHSPSSTQAVGRRLVREYNREGVGTPAVDIVAWEQKAGQGRRDHLWSSPPGLGLYLTMVRPLTPGPELQLLPLVAAIALCELLAPMTGDRCRIKWPNDLMIGDRKLGGQLIEVSTRGDAEAVALLGFGINHGGSTADFEAPAATTLSEELVEGSLSLIELADRVVAAIDHQLATLGSYQPAAVVARYTSWSLHRPGDALRCRQDEGEVEGVFEGFDEHGFLRLRVASAERRISSGVLLKQ